MVVAMGAETRRAEHERLSRFLSEMLPILGRLERRRWGEVYVRGLLSSGERKTSAWMAERLPDGEEQALQQFVGQSPWPWDPLRERLARHMVEALEPVAAWIVDDTGFPKKGTHSVGVARQYSGTLGKVGNCQVAVSLHYATDDAAIPLSFALYLPEEWLTPTRREEAGIPETVTFKTKWAMALGLIDQARTWDVPAGIVAADAGYGNVTDFRLGLVERKLQYAVGIGSVTAVWLESVVVAAPPHRGPGRPRTRPANLPNPTSVAELARQLPAESWRWVTWREGTKGPMTSRFVAIRVRPSHRHQHQAPKEEPQWLLVEWQPSEPAPDRFWLSNVAPTTDLPALVRLVKIRWWIEQGYQQLKDELGLDHYEGRSWQGWHHHVTLTMMAFAFLVIEMLRLKKNGWAEFASAEGAP
jgi:SRSO17 transposase